MTPSQGQDRGARPASRIAYLDSIRGLAALQVLLLHFFAAFVPNLVFAPVDAAPLATSIHLSPVYFLYDGYAAVYVFFLLSGYVLTRSFSANLGRPTAIAGSRIARLGIPALAATALSFIALHAFGRPNAAAGALLHSPWFADGWNPDRSILSLLRDGVLNAVFLGYRDLPGVAFLAPWQQATPQSFVAPFWTLSVEFYGSMLVLLLCLIERRSRRLWWCVFALALLFTVRSAYLCFVLGHLWAVFHRAETPPRHAALAALSISAGVLLCVAADVWQPVWLRWLCENSALPLFPGQFAPMQQKAFGAILVLWGIINLDRLRAALSHPALIRFSKLSFPIYLTHWPVLFGPTAALFLLLREAVDLDVARGVAILCGITLALAASLCFYPVDRLALDLSRRLRRPSATFTGSIEARLIRPRMAASE
jgi:peptidoglycan/LPS O-acetylase OafA/YrhL